MSSQLTTKILYLNVGGRHFSVSVETLRCEPRSLLAEWFQGPEPPLSTDRNQNYFIDRDPKTFGIILNYLRLKSNGQLWQVCLPKDPDRLALLSQEAEYFRMPQLRREAIRLLHSGAALAEITEATDQFFQVLVESRSSPAGSVDADGEDNAGDRI